VTDVMRLGVFGGAFDPPHLGHVALAQAGLTQLQLDRLLILPTGQAWYKPQHLSAAQHRLAMCALAFLPLGDRVVIDDRETRRVGPSYTIDTLQELKQSYPHAQLFLLMGDDQWRSLPSWHRIEELARLAIISPVCRDPQVAAWGGSSSPSDGGTQKLYAQLQVQALNMSPMPQSGTAIRQRATGSQSLDGAVSPTVAQYIEQHHLYRSDT
jgi:nicotinate-nucleotide adenylyltransferase